MRDLSRRKRRSAVAAIAVALVLAGAGTAAANDWVDTFRTEQIVPVAVSADDLMALPDLSAYGEVVVTGDVNLRSVPDADAASHATGLDVPVVDELPRGVSDRPAHRVGDRVTATLTFTLDETKLPSAPPGLAGSRMDLTVGPGVATIWPSESGLPSMMVARIAAPSFTSTGVPFEDARDYLLSLPGLPDGVAERLRTFDPDGSTLLLPLPADRVTTEQVEVAGSPATLIISDDGALTGVVWVADGVVTVVAGALDPDEVLTVAEHLR